MSVQALSAPTARFTVELPDEALAALRAVFPGVAVVAGGEAAADGHFALRREAGAWRLELAGAWLGRYATAAHAVAALEQRVLEKIARSAGDRVALHAGAVDVGGSACLLAGPAETGKSSCAVQLVELGGVFVADEVALVAAGANRALPFARTPAVGGGFVDELRSAGPPRRGRLVELEPALVRYVPRRLAAAPVEVSDLLLPRYRRGVALEVVELDAGQALPEVLGYCFEPRPATGSDDEGLERFVDRLIGLLERWTVRRLSYGDAAAARGALAALFPALAESAR